MGAVLQGLLGDTLCGSRIQTLAVRKREKTGIRRQEAKTVGENGSIRKRF